MSNLDRKSKCWSFIFTSWNDHDIDHLCNLPASFKFEYLSFGVCVDDTGNRFLQGFIQMEKRCYRSMLCHEIGENAIYDTSQCNDDILYVLVTIQLGEFPMEFGSSVNSRFGWFLSELNEFKKTVRKFGIPPEQVGRRFPRICAIHPLLVIRYIKEITPEPQFPQVNPRTRSVETGYDTPPKPLRTNLKVIN